MRRTFKDPMTQRAYDIKRATPPTSRLGGGMCSAYFQGLENPDKPAKHIRGSLAYAAWAAGVDTARDAAKAR